jgi:hypothetical protein
VIRGAVRQAILLFVQGRYSCFELSKAAFQVGAIPSLNVVVGDSVVRLAPLGLCGTLVKMVLFGRTG